MIVGTKYEDNILLVFDPVSEMNTDWRNFGYEMKKKTHIGSKRKVVKDVTETPKIDKMSDL